MSTPDMHAFLAAFDALPLGWTQGEYAGTRWAATVTGGLGEPVRKLYAERLAGGDHVSFNLYTTARGAQLKPCEMPEAKVIDFVLGFAPDP
ncbi:hypothetical protein L2D01_05230 [Hyphomonadaceae bacterium ML37]|nr:hypothetical protein L2D01_05230 [Hyphomonadaceae bacterium ML37]